MMISALNGLWRLRTVQSYGPDVIEKGKRVRPTPTESNMLLVIIPLTPTQLRHLPEGKYTTGDMQVYGKAALPLKQGDVILHNDSRYRVEDFLDRSFEGGFFKAIAKKERV